MPLSLSGLLEIGVVPFVGATPVLDQVLARSRREARVDHVLDLRGLAGQVVGHDHVVGARRVEDFLDARHAGLTARRTPQLPFMKSSRRSAVVLGSTVTGLSSGAGGVFTVAQSATMSRPRPAEQQ